MNIRVQTVKAVQCYVMGSMVSRNGVTISDDVVETRRRGEPFVLKSIKGDHNFIGATNRKQEDTAEVQLLYIDNVLT